MVRRQLKSKESSGNTDSVKLQHAESKLSELRTTLAALGKEATAAMEAVEAQQQQITFDRLLAMVWYASLFFQNMYILLTVEIPVHGHLCYKQNGHKLPFGFVD